MGFHIMEGLEMKHIVLVLFLLLMVGCQPADQPAELEQVSEETAPEVAPEPAAPEPEPEENRLARVLAEQAPTVQARFPYRNPYETLNFFGIEPGMTVVEALPGGGWYTRILLPFLGEEGKLIAANYPLALFPHFDWVSEEFLAGLPAWPETFANNAGEMCFVDCAPVAAFWLGDLPEELQGTADAVLFIRILQNLARFQNEGVDDFLDQSFADAYAVLRPGGVLGVVQHEAREDMPDDWANGTFGYLKKSFVVARAEAAGFELAGESAVNENPADQPTVEESVWRLPPTLMVHENGDPDEQRARHEAIGESHRMTLKFVKPER